MARQNWSLTINYSYFPNSHSQRPPLNPPPSIFCLIVSKQPFKSNHLRIVYKADSCAHFTCKSRTFQRKTRMGKKEGWLRVSDIPASQCLMAHHPAMWHLQNIGEFPPCLHYGNGARETLMRTYGRKPAWMTLWACFEKYCAIICHVLVFIK